MEITIPVWLMDKKQSLKPASSDISPNILSEFMVNLSETLVKCPLQISYGSRCDSYAQRYPKYSVHSLLDLSTPPAAAWNQRHRWPNRDSRENLRVASGLRSVIDISRCISYITYIHSPTGWCPKSTESQTLRTSETLFCIDCNGCIDFHLILLDLIGPRPEFHHMTTPLLPKLLDAQLAQLSNW